MSATALIDDDEPLLRERLVSHLARLWPELQVVAQARNGREAVELFDEHTPQVVFMDVHMPRKKSSRGSRGARLRSTAWFITLGFRPLGARIFVLRQTTLYSASANARRPAFAHARHTSV